MPEPQEAPDTPLDEVLSRIEAGARAGGARDYLLDYTANAKANVFNLLVTAQPTFDALLRVWGVAVGIDAIERDNKQAIQEGAEARQILTGGPSDPGQAEHQ